MFLSVLLLLGGISYSSASSPQYGFVTSPHFPKMYPIEKHVTWNIAVPEGYKISLKFLAFNIENSEGCTQDFVAISEPRNARHAMIPGLPYQVWGERKELGRFCGPINSSSHPGHQRFVSDGNKMTIEFHSDFSNEMNDSTILYSGFQAFYQAVAIGFENSQDLLKAAYCENPARIDYGEVAFGLTIYQSEAKYNCKSEYYTLVGEDTYHCSLDGLWVNSKGQSDPPTCKPVCGKPSNPVTGHSRIIGGKTAEPGNFPWQVLLEGARHSSGGGILIGEHWVMTTASAIEAGGSDDYVRDTQLFIGNTNEVKLKQQGPLAVQEVYVHPNYTEGLYDHDIALIRLKDPVTMDQNTSPICLPEDDDESLYEAGNVGYVSGFGATKRTRPSRLLKYVALPMVQRNRCQQQLEKKKWTMSTIISQFTENMFCAGYPESEILKKDACEGDAGGAFASLNEDKWVATGIVSWGFDCGTYYGYYTKVINYMDWIKGHLLS